VPDSIAAGGRGFPPGRSRLARGLLGLADRRQLFPMAAGAWEHVAWCEL